MEKKINKWCICITFILVVGLICGFTTYKVVRSHNEKLTLVETKYIIETARKCINEHKCKDKNNVTLNTVNDILISLLTLKELYDLKYLDKQVNSVTKEYYNENSYVKYSNSEYVFIDIT